MQERDSENAMAEVTYKVTVFGFDSGLNEVLNGVHYDYKTKRIANPVKKKNDEICIRALRLVKNGLAGKKLKTPIKLHYKIYAKDRRRDRMNIASAFDKSFEDALQKTGKISNDGWNDVLGASFEFDIDALNPRVEVLITECGSKTGVKGF